MSSGQVGPPAPNPCTYCPYRLDVPSGVWHETEYEKLPRYDQPTFSQPPALFHCHVNDATSKRSLICGGWAGCHDGDHLLALRVAVAWGLITPETAQATAAYTTPIPLFGSGAEAAAHGMADIKKPSVAAERAMDKIGRRRSDLRDADGVPFHP